MTRTGTQYATFWVGPALYGIEVGRVREVLRRPQITPVPLAPVTVAGLINLRGHILTTIDLRRRLQLPGDPAAEPMLVVVLADGEPVALQVDRVGDVVDIGDAGFEPAPDTVVGPIRELVTGAHQLAGGLLLKLDLDVALAA